MSPAPTFHLCFAFHSMYYQPTHILNGICKIKSFPLGEGGLVVWQLGHSWPGLGRRCHQTNIFGAFLKNQPVQLVCQGCGRSWTTGQSLNLPDQTPISEGGKKRQKIKGGLKTWKRGLAPIISATMAPNDQMSIGVEYLAQPSRISGALAKELGQCLNQRVEGTYHMSWIICWNIQKQDHLYHRVTTSWVYTLTGTPKARASPKSAILITYESLVAMVYNPSICRSVITSSNLRALTPSLSMSKLAGFKSLCITRRWWQKSSPCWQKQIKMMILIKAPLQS